MEMLLHKRRQIKGHSQYPLNCFLLLNVSTSRILCVLTFRPILEVLQLVTQLLLLKLNPE